MTWSNWLVFCGVSLFMAFTPGPAVLLAVSNAVSVGPRRAMWGSLGNAVGVFLVSAVAMAGLGVLLSSSATAFMVLKLAGAAYLVYLGIRQWRSGANAFADTRRPAEGRLAARHPPAVRAWPHGGRDQPQEHPVLLGPVPPVPDAGRAGRGSSSSS